MAGRPRTMSRRVQQLVERYVKIAEELRELMPKQYLESSHDLLGRCWQKAVEATESGYDYLFDLACLLEFKADAAEKRARAANEPSPLVDDRLPSQEEHPTDRAGCQ